MKPKKRKKSIVAWAGIVEDNIYTIIENDQYGETMRHAIYMKRKDARERFQCVRKVRIEL